jgi:hypothetical protein
MNLNFWLGRNCVGLFFSIANFRMYCTDEFWKVRFQFTSRCFFAEWIFLLFAQVVTLKQARKINKKRDDVHVFREISCDATCCLDIPNQKMYPLISNLPLKIHVQSSTIKT